MIKDKVVGEIAPSPFIEQERLYHELLSVVRGYDNELSNAQAVGILEMVKVTIIEGALNG